MINIFIPNDNKLVIVLSKTAPVVNHFQGQENPAPCFEVQIDIINLRQMENKYITSSFLNVNLYVNENNILRIQT